MRDRYTTFIPTVDGGSAERLYEYAISHGEKAGKNTRRRVEAYIEKERTMELAMERRRRRTALQRRNPATRAHQERTTATRRNPMRDHVFRVLYRTGHKKKDVEKIFVVRGAPDSMAARSRVGNVAAARAVDLGPISSVKELPLQHEAARKALRAIDLNPENRAHEAARRRAFEEAGGEKLRNPADRAYRERWTAPRRANPHHESYDREQEFVDSMKTSGWWLWDAMRTREAASDAAQGARKSSPEAYPVQVLVRTLPGQPEGGLKYGIFIRHIDGSPHHLAGPHRRYPNPASPWWTHQVEPGE